MAYSSIGRKPLAKELLLSLASASLSTSRVSESSRDAVDKEALKIQDSFVYCCKGFLKTDYHLFLVALGTRLFFKNQKNCKFFSNLVLKLYLAESPKALFELFPFF